MHRWPTNQDKESWTTIQVSKEKTRKGFVAIIHDNAVSFHPDCANSAQFSFSFWSLLSFRSNCFLGGCLSLHTACFLGGCLSWHTACFLGGCLSLHTACFLGGCLSLHTACFLGGCLSLHTACATSRAGGKITFDWSSYAIPIISDYGTQARARSLA